MKTVTFPRWPTWNFTFPELDVVRIAAVKYCDEKNIEQTLPPERVRLAVGRNGVSAVVFKEKHNLPALTTSQRADAVTIEYEVS